MITVLIADDHRLFRKGIMTLLKDHKDIIIVGEAESGEEMIVNYFMLRPDIILADISMPDISGIEAFEKILKKDREAKAVFLSMHDGEEYISRVYRAGGKGLVSKNCLENELPYIIQRIYNGEMFFGDGWTHESIIALTNKNKLQSPVSNLKDIEKLFSPRELEVFIMIGEGYSSNGISKALFISKKTVDHHRENIKAKLGANSFHDVFKLAVKFSILR